LCDCLDETLKYDDSVITNFFINFDEKNDTNNKFRKDRTKKVYRILDDNIKKMKYNLYPKKGIHKRFTTTSSSFLVWRLRISTTAVTKN
jgi:hypothetical protein